MNETSATKTRFLALDAWRGMCALMVALFHFNAQSDLSIVPLVRNSWIFVDFFFVLSGFVITHGYLERIDGWRPAAGFIVRRIGRLWPLHLAMLLVLVVFELIKIPLASHGYGIRQEAFDGLMSLQTLPRELLLLNAWGTTQLYWNTPSWSIGAEFYTYLCFAALALFSRRHWFPAACLAVIGAAVLVTRSQHYIDTAYDYGLFRCFYGFFVGQLAYRFWRWTQRPLKRAPATALEALVLAVALAFVWIQPGDAGPLSMAAPPIFAATIYVFASQCGVLSGILSRGLFEDIGRWSYSIYMVHYPFLVVSNRAIKFAEQVLHISLTMPVHSEGETVYNIYFGSYYATDAAAIVYLALIVAISSWTYRYIEMPGQQLFARIARRIEGPPSLVRRPATSVPPPKLATTALENAPE